ncbi:MAG: hypothetical protein Q4G33_10015 [bacterium]|nr:hypothetical protein [bacterium]
MAALNRSMRPADVYRLTGEYDEYGTETASEPAGTCRIFITLYNQNNTQDARFKDVTHVGYTDRELTDSMSVVQSGRTYKVMLSNPYARKCVVFLREVV